MKKEDLIFKLRSAVTINELEAIRKYIFASVNNKLNPDIYISEEDFESILAELFTVSIQFLSAMPNTHISRKNGREFYDDARRFWKSNEGLIVNSHLTQSQKDHFLKIQFQVAELIEDAAVWNLSQFFYRYRLANDVGRFIFKLKRFFS